MGAKYIPATNSKTAVILAHGRGKHPTWKVVNPLRKGIFKKLGYHTLSLQMPNEKKNWAKYASDFPEAYEMIRKGIQFLRDEKDVSRIFLVGHSMGSRMVSAFVSMNPREPISGLIVVGCRNNGGFPLSCDRNLSKTDIPVLDIWGEADETDMRDATMRMPMVSSNYTQLSIPGANHRLEGYSKELVTAVAKWLSSQ